MELQLEFQSSKKEVLKLRAEKRSVELQHKQTIHETTMTLSDDMSVVEQEISKYLVKQKAEFSRLNT